MKTTNKLAISSAIAMVLSTGAAQAAVQTATVAITGAVAPIVTACTLTATSLNFGSIAPGAGVRSNFTATTSCNVATPLNYTFSSNNPGSPTGGRLVGAGGCALDYSLVSYSPDTFQYGTANFFQTPPPAVTTNAQTVNYGVLVAANQTTCPVALGSSVPVAGNITITLTY